MLADGRFRKDLFYRLNVIPINILPLRERKPDIISIDTHLLGQMAQEANIPQINLGRKAEKALRSCAWQGHVRELSNVLERTMASLEGNTIHLQDLPFYLHRSRKKKLVTNLHECPRIIEIFQSRGTHMKPDYPERSV